MQELMSKTVGSSSLSRERVETVQYTLMSSTVVGWIAWSQQSGCQWNSDTVWEMHAAKAAPFVGLLATLFCWSYAKRAGAGAQSAYVHLAGGYFLCTSVACCFMDLAVYASCTRWRNIEVMSLGVLLVCEAAAYGLLQMMLRRRVEALNGSYAAEAESWFYRTAVLFVCWGALFMRRVFMHSANMSSAEWHETFVGVLVVLGLLQFTIVCVRAMAEASELVLNTGSADQQTKESGRVVWTHTLAAGVAGGASTLQMAVLVLSQLPYWDIEETFVKVHFADVLCNLLCAYFLCGLADQKDVLGEFSVAGAAARSADKYGGVETAMGPVNSGSRSIDMMPDGPL